MRLTVIGSAAAYTRRAGAASSCYLVEEGDAALVLDLGQGSFAELSARREPATITAILVSHLHPDHHIDLVPMRHFLLYGQPEQASVELRAPGDLRARYDVLLGEPDFLRPLPGPPLEPGTFEMGPFTVEVARVAHTEESHAVRVATAGAGGGLVYSGDCGRAADLLPLIRPGDTLLCEASFGAGPRPEGVPHLTSDEAAEAAALSGAARLILTHILDDREPEATLAAARRAFSGPSLLAYPGLVIQPV